MVTDKSKYNNFDLLRLIFASMVMIGHFVYLTRAPLHSFIFSYPNFAVEGFFVISGYLIYGSFVRSPVLLPYAIRRICRIYPLYAVAVVVQAALMILLLPGSIFGYVADIAKYVVVNLAFANFLSPDIAGLTAKLPEPEINPSMWTLKVEVAFYIVLPILAILVKRYGMWVIVAIFVASSIYSVVLLDLGHAQLARQLPGQLRYFVIGIALYEFRDSIRPPVWVSAILTAVFFAMASVGDSEWLRLSRPLIVGGVVLLFGQRLPAVAVKRDISYGVYLIHGPVIQLGILSNLVPPSYGGLAMVVIVVVGLALLSERFIERPAIELGKRFTKESKRPEQGAELQQPV
jgi:peptidoglycan/LPS O-acetylase OafA/YrhL